MQNRIFRFSIFILWLSLAGCDSSPNPATQDISLTHTLPPPQIYTLSPSPSPPLSPSPSPLLSPSPSPLLSPSPSPPLSRSPFPFQVPVPAGFRQEIDPSYRFATTQDGQRDPHHGVEFLNSFGTPVLAAAEGTVLFAGDDNNGGPYSPAGWFAFFGNFVVIEHSISGFNVPIFTLYAHLSEIKVGSGDGVAAGQEIGLVGLTGAAVGSHLHFEVRYGDSGYTASRNPEIYLQPDPNSGVLIGRIRDAADLPIPVFPLTLKPIDIAGRTHFFSTYEDRNLANQLPHFENFALGNLPAGQYDLSFIAYSLETHQVEIKPGAFTFIDIIVGDEDAGG